MPTIYHKDTRIKVVQENHEVRIEFRQETLDPVQEVVAVLPARVAQELAQIIQAAAQKGQEQ